jgi:hypothetical protein
MAYESLGQAYSVLPLLERSRWMWNGATPTNPYLRHPSEYQLNGNLVLDDIGLYQYTHTHNNMRGIALSGADCPQGQSIDQAGNCEAVCESNKDCPLGLYCLSGRCVREKCNNDTDCSSGYCYTQPDLKDYQQYCVPISCGPYSGGDCITTPSGNFKGRSLEDSHVLMMRYYSLYGVSANPY